MRIQIHTFRATTAAILLTAVCTTASKAQVNLPDGFEIVEFGVSDDITARPFINNCGEVVYRKGLDHGITIYRYDNWKITVVAEGAAGGILPTHPDINDAGTITWSRGLRNQPDTWEVVVLENGDIIPLGVGTNPRINNAGHIVAKVFRNYTCQSEWDIVLFRDGKTITIIDDLMSNQQPIINNLDQVVWDHSNNCRDPWMADLLMYVDGTTLQVTPTENQYTNHDVNNHGQVVWRLLGDIYVWDFGMIRKIIFGSASAGGPSINDDGDIFFTRWNENARRSNAWYYRVENAVPVEYRLTHDEVDDQVGDINKWGEAVWRYMRFPQQGDFGGGMRYLRRVRTGDARFDGRIDLEDLAAVTDCMTGPGRVDRLCDCRFLDIDHDGDVDLSDVARFQNAFTGD